MEGDDVGDVAGGALSEGGTPCQGGGDASERTAAHKRPTLGQQKTREDTRSIR